MQFSSFKILHNFAIKYTMEEVTETSHRLDNYVLYPGDDTSEAPQEIQDLAAELWTPAVVAATASTTDVRASFDLTE